MGIVRTIAGRRPGRRFWLVGGLLAALVAALTTLGLTSLAWGDSLREEGRLLPGTTIGSVDVGDATVEEAVAAVTDQFEPVLDRTVVVTYEDHSWETSAQELGGVLDVEPVVEQAFEHTTDAGLADLARLRWAGANGPELHVSMGVPDDEIDAFVGAIAEQVDRAPQDAALDWDGETLEVGRHVDGHSVDQASAARALGLALDGEATTVDLPVEVDRPEVTTEEAQQAAERLGPAVESALDHEVTLAHEDRTWSTTPRELGAAPELEPALAEALDGETPDVGLTTSGEALETFVATVAGEIDVAPRDAEFAWAGGDIEIKPDRDGLAVDREQAVEGLDRALRGDTDQVDLATESVTASVTEADFDRVLVLRQDERRLYLYEDREVADEWPVAVGQGGSPTPTGTFSIGAMRFEPTWYNPAPNGWGSNMPAQIGPGADNPLGLRALNWNDEHGNDTLIRFHGTPNEASIGQAASRGCVRMFNSDVVDLYDRVESGTMIVSMG